MILEIVAAAQLTLEDVVARLVMPGTQSKTTVFHYAFEFFLALLETCSPV